MTATEAEALYFSQMRKDCRYSNMTVVWQETFSDLHQLISITARMRTSGSYTSAWLVFGLADLSITSADVKKEMEYAERRKVNLGWNNRRCRSGTSCTCRHQGASSQTRR